MLTEVYLSTEKMHDIRKLSNFDKNTITSLFNALY